MKKKRGAVIIGGVLLGAALMAPAAFAGRGGSAGRQWCNGNPAACRQQYADCDGGRQRLRDGSCRNRTQRDANCPGPPNCLGPANQQGPGGGTSGGADNQ